MRQLILASMNFDKHSKHTRRAKFLAEMNEVVPWQELCAVVEPFYPKLGNGRPLWVTCGLINLFAIRRRLLHV